jgi:hypothetical protein
MAARQLLAYRFGSDSQFEGQLVGALERAESGGAIRVVEGLFVQRQPESGELTAVSLSGGTGGMISKLLGFRLDERERIATTKRALDGEAGDVIRTVGDSLEPGSAVAAVLVEHVWAGVLGDAVTRVGGAEVANDFVEASGIHEVAERLLSVTKESG